MIYNEKYKLENKQKRQYNIYFGILSINDFRRNDITSFQFTKT